MSVAFTKEDSAETASETLLPDRPVSPHPNLVFNRAGLKEAECLLAIENRQFGQPSPLSNLLFKVPICTST